MNAIVDQSFTMMPGPQDIAVANLLEQTARAIYDRRGPMEIHPGQWAALRFFARANRAASTVAGLARYLGVTAAPASRAVTALRRQGLVTTEKNANDRRSSTVILTEQGQALLAEDPMHRLARAITGLEPAERALLGRLLAELSDRLGADSLGPQRYGVGQRETTGAEEDPSG